MDGTDSKRHAVYRYIDRQTDNQRWIDNEMDRLKKRQVDHQTERWMDGTTDYERHSR